MSIDRQLLAVRLIAVVFGLLLLSVLSWVASELSALSGMTFALGLVLSVIIAALAGEHMLRLLKSRGGGNRDNQ